MPRLHDIHGVKYDAFVVTDHNIMLCASILYVRTINCMNPSYTKMEVQVISNL